MNLCLLTSVWLISVLKKYSKVYLGIRDRLIRIIKKKGDLSPRENKVGEAF